MDQDRVARLQSRPWHLGNSVERRVGFDLIDGRKNGRHKQRQKQGEKKCSHTALFEVRSGRETKRLADRFKQVQHFRDYHTPLLAVYKIKTGAKNGPARASPLNQIVFIYRLIVVVVVVPSTVNTDLHTYEVLDRDIRVRGFGTANVVGIDLKDAKLDDLLSGQVCKTFCS